MTGFGLTPPVATLTWGVLMSDAGNGPVFLLPCSAPGRQHRLRRRCAAIEDAGGRPLPLYCASLRTAEPRLLERFSAADAMVVTVLAAGGVGRRPAGGDDDSWNVELPGVGHPRSCKACV